MAIRARLAASPVPPLLQLESLAAKWTSLASHILWKGDRRMEAETYLSSGYGLRLAIEERAVGWRTLGQIASVWQPSRLKGIRVGPEFGTPFLAATQVFDMRPLARKWLALSKTENAIQRYVKPGVILVSCSGSVGRSTVAFGPTTRSLVSHDLLRVESTVEGLSGWIYAYLRSPQAQAMMIGAQYGHIIKHLETAHLNALPVPIVKPALAEKFQKRFSKLLELRSRAASLGDEAESTYGDVIGSLGRHAPETGYSVSASDCFERRRRFEASYHSPYVAALLKRFEKIGRVEPLSAVTKRAWWMGRFRRFYGVDGIPYLSADELFTTNPSDSKRILVQQGDGHQDFFVTKDWLVMACSGQIYGLNGAVRLMTAHHENTFFSHDLIRIIPDLNVVRAGYLLIALTHPEFGRPLLIRSAYGTSIPHLDPSDVATFPVLRVEQKIENRIADLAEQSAKDRAEADALDRSLSEDAGNLIDKFLAKETDLFSVQM